MKTLARDFSGYFAAGAEDKEALAIMTKFNQRFYEE